MRGIYDVVRIQTQNLSINGQESNEPIYASGLILLVTMLVANKKSTEMVLDFVGVDGFEPPTLCL